MAKKFDLNKGERFNLSKGSNLEKLEIELGWKGEDLDASTFLLGEDGIILQDADFVYFKSDNREEPFDKTKFGNKAKWRKETRPMSHDGSVIGSIDETGDDDGQESNETIHVDLDNVDAQIKEIIFVVTIYNRDGDTKITFSDIVEPYIKIINKNTKAEILQYKLLEKFGNETGVEVGKLICNIDGEWEFEAVGKAYEGGLQTFVDMYT